MIAIIITINAIQASRDHAEYTEGERSARSADRPLSKASKQADRPAVQRAALQLPTIVYTLPVFGCAMPTLPPLENCAPANREVSGAGNSAKGSKPPAESRKNEVFSRKSSPLKAGSENSEASQPTSAKGSSPSNRDMQPVEASPRGYASPRSSLGTKKHHRPPTIHSAKEARGSVGLACHFFAKGASLQGSSMQLEGPVFFSENLGDSSLSPGEHASRNTSNRDSDQLSSRVVSVLAHDRSPTATSPSSRGVLCAEVPGPQRTDGLMIPPSVRSKPILDSGVPEEGKHTERSLVVGCSGSSQWASIRGSQVGPNRGQPLFAAAQPSGSRPHGPEKATGATASWKNATLRARRPRDVITPPRRPGSVGGIPRTSRSARGPQLSGAPRGRRSLSAQHKGASSEQAASSSAASPQQSVAKSMSSRLFLVVVAIATLLASVAWLATTRPAAGAPLTSFCHTSSCRYYARLLESSANDDVDPCEDFYQHVCGGWDQAGRHPVAKLIWHEFLNKSMTRIAARRVATSNADADNAARYIKACMAPLAHDNIAKTDDNILNEMPDDLIEIESLSACKYGDKVVRMTSKLLFELQNSRTSQASRQRSSPASVSVKSRLPQLELMKFDGNRKQWHRFLTQFSTAVHKKEELSTADKFNYLSTLLSRAAASAISGLQATEEYYQDAIDILKKRFGIASIIVQEDLRSLLD
ncbi:hypothetical protein HPB49_005296 [Dermacentor silvarum]|uniref:Uncharacterized protein n=1 Tax=Dermacentor silvarum TaxID=543639 RepID=A0ACB8DN58_DERSI|nr:hypothetical protein HPB49_005296 [Dermacentor silvarum]